MSVSRFLSLFVFMALTLLPAQADFLRVEGGVGLFNAEPGGSIEPSGGGTFDLENAGVDTRNDLYVWAYLKQPVPLIPNVRVEYLSLTNSPDGSSDFTIQELDGILYYNLLDDTLFVTLDLGIDVKYVDSDMTAGDGTATLGLLYGRLRFEPTTWLGFETQLSLTNYAENKGYDARVKVDYTLTFMPVVQPAVEVGYRIHKLQYEIGDTLYKPEYSGVYAGLMVRF